MDSLFINGKCDGYEINQCGKTLTVGDLIGILEEYDENMPVYLNNDNGYSFGSITRKDIHSTDDEV